MERVLGGLVLEPELSDYGLYVEDVQITPEPIFTDGARRFDLLSPVFLKNPTGPEVVGPADHLRYDDPRAQEVLTGALRNKLTAAGLDPTGVKVAFFDPYPAAKVRLQQYRDITNRVNKCPVVVTGSAAQQRFAWLVGAGHSTGIGFGALR
jgi:CRISPR-associated endoribonuclease Cas6